MERRPLVVPVRAVHRHPVLEEEDDGLEGARAGGVVQRVGAVAVEGEERAVEREKGGEGDGLVGSRGF